MTNAKQYQRQFWMTAIRQLPHHTLLVTSTRLDAGWLTKALEKSSTRKLARFPLKPYGVETIATYQTTIKGTKLWHGTGRFQYRDGEVIDVLAIIAKQGTLNPAHDAYALLAGGEQMVSISTTPLRIVARAYADMHGQGEQEPHRYGTALWWVSYYYSLFYGKLFTRNIHLVLRNYSKWHRTSSGAHGERLWGMKVHRSAISVWDVFGLGSDIKGNYPIIFGISNHGKPIQLPKAFEQFEVRLGQQLPLSDISHIEVPESKINETRALLAKYGYDIPVFPIELGEFVASRTPFSQLLGLSGKHSSMN